MSSVFADAEAHGLYRAAYEHDGCGVAWVAKPGQVASHELIDRALSVLARMSHRGGAGADPDTGDGCGVLLDLDTAFFRQVAAKQGLALPSRFAVGVLFVSELSKMDALAQLCVRMGMPWLGWRPVPVSPEVLGISAQQSRPEIVHFFIGLDENASVREQERLLYGYRRAIEKADSDLYICSLSSRTIVYKGLLTPQQLGAFYSDLRQPTLRSTAALVHQRFSTNTQPSWQRAHPYRMLAHNGEINTIRGNPQSFEVRESALGKSWQQSRPLIDPRGSDSAQLDNAVEALVHLGWSLDEALALVLPPVMDTDGDPVRVDRLQSLAVRMEAWDGPAAVLAYDGERLVARLDRNGLRPLRWWQTDQGWSFVASEMGVDAALSAESSSGEIIASGRVGPGQSVALDVRTNVFETLDHAWSTRPLTPLQQTRLQAPPTQVSRAPSEALLARYTWNRELIDRVLLPMAERGEEVIGSMGSDTPIAPYARHQPRFFDVFRQQFAQVTNPPIDAIREERVMDVKVWLGAVGSLDPKQDGPAMRLAYAQPFISSGDVQALQQTRVLSVATLLCSWPALSVGHGVVSNEGSARALSALCEHAEQAVRAGAEVLVLSDADPSRAPMPSALAIAAVRTHLRRADLLGRVSLVMDAGDVVTTHDASVLVALGAHLVCPRLALQLIGASENLGAPAQERYLGALKKGLKKIMSKMGVSMLAAFRGASLVETLGMAASLRVYFPDAPHRLGGIELATLNHATTQGAAADAEIPTGGYLQWRRDGEVHLWSPEAIGALQHATRSGRFELFEKFARLANQSAAHNTLRGQLHFAAQTALAVDRVEGVASIVKRFKTGAMSLGSISPEVHEMLAIAMNTLGGRSNTGEGGEDPARFGTIKRSAIKQVASGRFGVTINYLAEADELQIKMAQGAKPGEGGQLPGHKVNALIARLRCSTEGVTLISPPPHHDIYSIEDLAQLIHDLKAANPRARVSVKLVAESGVGTIAAGVAKAGADVIVISGDSGGTGASPVSSIRHAGVPWELGLAEAHQTLLANGLRSRVRLETDGLLRTGRDVVVAALLGADEFAFATSALVAAGCVLMRVCHLNTCPVGIATQDETLRARFAGEPEHVMNFMRFLAEDVRLQLAALGLTSLQDAVGRTDLLRAEGELNRLLYRPTPSLPASATHETRRLAVTPIDDAAIAAMHSGANELAIVVDNRHRSIGARLSYQRIVDQSATAPFTLRCSGVAGQSFAAFLGAHVTVALRGFANDHVGKGLSGGTVIVQPARRVEQMALIGNVAFFGATSGKGYIAGAAGERFAVRNSGAELVVESVGEHGCEYMTRGVVVVLGEVGRNFAAGMSGGVAFVAPHHELARRAHQASVVLEPLREDDHAVLRTMVEQHYRLTDSRRAWTALQGEHLRDFVRVTPREQALAPVAAKRREEVVTPIGVVEVHVQPSRVAQGGALS
jgi:glutamate synthase (NADPH/NADH) large chain